MGLQQRGAHWYGDGHDDIRGELARYSGLVGYPAERFADARCVCGGRLFTLELDEAAGVAVRGCASCGARHVMADGAAYLARCPACHLTACYGDWKNEYAGVDALLAQV